MRAQTIHNLISNPLSSGHTAGCCISFVVLLSSVQTASHFRLVFCASCGVSYLKCQRILSVNSNRINFISCTPFTELERKHIWRLKKFVTEYIIEYFTLLHYILKVKNFFLSVNVHLVKSLPTFHIQFWHFHLFQRYKLVLYETFRLNGLDRNWDTARPGT